MRLNMTIQARQELLEVLRMQYPSAGPEERKRILTGFVEATGYSRKHAISLLNKKTEQSRKRLGRRSKIGKDVLLALIEVWHLSNRICSKRLVPFLPDLVQELERAQALQLTAEGRSQLLALSASSVDRLLKGERRKYERSRSTTKRSSLVRSKVKVRTFTEWSDVTPGFFEIDTVAHCSRDVSGRYLSTLNMTDIATCWTEPIALTRKGSIEVIAALEKVLEVLPFPLKGLDSDNGSEFMNEDFVKWCELKRLTFTRSREYKKNDQAWIEEKNGSVVRKLVGKSRYEGKKAWRILNEYYSVARLYINFFQPTQKLLFKHRKGSKTYRIYDRARTPYQRVLESAHVSEQDKNELRRLKEGLSMVRLKKELERLGADLRKLAVDSPDPLVAAAVAQRIATHKFIRESNQRAHSLTELQPMQRNRFEAELRRTIQALPGGTLISAKDFLETAKRSTVDSALMRLLKDGSITRIGWGQYQIPEHALPVEC